jgi:hypothetical protein
LNLYNALNVNTVLNVTTLSGAAFARPTSIAPAARRRSRAGIQVLIMNERAQRRLAL